MHLPVLAILILILVIGLLMLFVSANGKIQKLGGYIFLVAFFFIIQILILH